MAKVKRPPKSSRPAPGQMRIAGTELIRNDRIHGAAKAYEAQRDARMRLTKKEKEQKDKLIEVMKEEGVDVYKDPDGYVVTLSGKTDVKVTDVATEDGDEAE